MGYKTKRTLRNANGSIDYNSLIIMVLLDYFLQGNTTKPNPTLLAICTTFATVERRKITRKNGPIAIEVLTRFPCIGSRVT